MMQSTAICALITCAIGLLLVILRQSAQTALHKKEAQYRILIETAYEGIWKIDAEAKTLFINQRMADMLGYHIEDILERPLFEFMDQEWRQKAQVLFENRKRGVAEQHEFCFQRQDGSPLWAIVSTTPICSDQGEFHYAFAMITDITERKQLEDRLRQYQHIVTALPDTVSFVDRNYVYRVINDEYLKRTGKPREAIVGHSVAEVMGEEVFQNLVRPKLDRCLNEEAVHYQAWFDFPILGRRFVDVDYSPYRDEQGIILGVVVSTRDITLLKQAEEVIIESRNELKTIYDSVPIMICQLDKNRKVKEANRYFRLFTGWPDHPISLSEKACGVLGCVNSLDDPRGCGFGPNCKTCSLRLAIMDTLKTGKTHTDIEYKTKLVINDVLKDIFLLCSTALIQKNNQDVVLVSMINITERKSMEEALHRSLDEKEVLLREVHHRVKNNFAAIISLVELQSQSGGNTPAPMLLTQLTQRLRSMVLVHEMLYRSEGLDQIDFHRYLQTLGQSLQDSFNPNGAIRLQTAAPGVWMSLDNAIPCGLIINELVTNAFKYAFPGNQPRTGADRCEIHVSATWDGKVYTVTIVDNGVGLPDTLDWISAPSLGLLLVRMLGRHQLQGCIELDRTSGTRFSLRFSANPRDGSVYH